MKDTILVEYGGEYPVTCMGRLKIYKNDELIYDKKEACHSTGCVENIATEPNDYEFNVVDGELLWDEEESEKYGVAIQNAVKEKLSECIVCCGGCI